MIFPNETKDLRLHKRFCRAYDQGHGKSFPSWATRLATKPGMVKAALAC